MYYYMITSGDPNLTRSTRMPQQHATSAPGNGSSNGDVHAHNLHMVRRLFRWRLRDDIDSFAKEQEWPSAVLKPAHGYVDLLIYGGGGKPAKLPPTEARHIQWRFMKLCCELIVGNDVLPGQKEYWYGPLLLKCTNECARNPWAHMPADSFPKAELVRNASVPRHLRRRDG